MAPLNKPLVGLLQYFAAIEKIGTDQLLYGSFDEFSECYLVFVAVPVENVFHQFRNGFRVCFRLEHESLFNLDEKKINVVQLLYMSQKEINFRWCHIKNTTSKPVKGGNEWVRTPSPY